MNVDSILEILNSTMAWTVYFTIVTWLLGWTAGNAVAWTTAISLKLNENKFFAATRVDDILLGCLRKVVVDLYETGVVDKYKTDGKRGLALAKALKDDILLSFHAGLNVDQTELLTAKYPDLDKAVLGAVSYVVKMVKNENKLVEAGVTTLSPVLQSGK